MRKLGNAMLVLGFLIVICSLAPYLMRDLLPSGGSDRQQTSHYLFLAGLAIVFIGQTVRSLQDAGEGSADLKTQFDLKFVLLWIFPSVALMAALVAWDGPFTRNAANWNFRLNALVIIMGAVAFRYKLSRFRRLAKNPSPSQPTDGPRLCERGFEAIWAIRPLR